MCAKAISSKNHDAWRGAGYPGAGAGAVAKDELVNPGRRNRLPSSRVSIVSANVITPNTREAKAIRGVRAAERSNEGGTGAGPRNRAVYRRARPRRLEVAVFKASPSAMDVERSC